MIHGCEFLLTFTAATFVAHGLHGGQPRRAIEPCGERFDVAKVAGLFGQDDEDALGDFFGQMRIACGVARD